MGGGRDLRAWPTTSVGHLSSLRDLQHGAERVARILVGFVRRPPREVRPVLVNGSFGLLVYDAAGVLSVTSFVVSDGRVTAVDIVRNPDKLAGVD